MLLKSLAIKVLQRNHKGNKTETSGFQGGKPDGTEFPSELNPGGVSLPDPLGDHQSVFEKADSEIDRAYIPGTLEFIREVFPELAEEIDRAEDQINQLWLKAREEAVDMEAFLGAVDTWRKLHLRGIRFFSIYERQGVN